MSTRRGGNRFRRPATLRVSRWDRGALTSRCSRERFKRPLRRGSAANFARLAARANGSGLDFALLFPLCLSFGLSVSILNLFSRQFDENGSVKTAQKSLFPFLTSLFLSPYPSDSPRIDRPIDRSIDRSIARRTPLSNESDRESKATYRRSRPRVARLEANFTTSGVFSSVSIAALSGAVARGVVLRGSPPSHAMTVCQQCRSRRLDK